MQDFDPTDLIETLDLAQVMARDLDGTVRFWAAGCARLYGWAASEAVGRSSHKLLKTSFPIPLAAIEAELVRNGEWEGDFEQTTKAGKRIIVRARKVLRRSPTGAPLAVMESVTDVTALRLAEQRLHALNEKLEDNVRAEVAARQEAQARLAHAEKLTALGQLAGGVAHDINNVLQVVQSATELVDRRAGQTEDVRRFASLIEQAASRGLNVVRRLLAFSRSDSLRVQTIDLSVTLDNLSSLLRHTLGPGVTIVRELPASLPDLVCDQGRLETVLVNLATNARDAMPQGGTLTLSATPMMFTNDHRLSEANTLGTATLAAGNYMRISLADNGEGMSTEVLARSMEPFFTTKPPGNGTGLGLAMARGFAEQSGGGLTLKSYPERGTIATLWLPLTTAVVGETLDVPLLPDPPIASKRLLVVDDDPLVLAAQVEQLLDAGFDVKSAKSGAEAIQLVRHGEVVDAIISDFAMPGLHGIETINGVRQWLPNLPAVLLTGFSGAIESKVDEMPKEFFRLIRKPTSLSGLLAALSFVCYGNRKETSYP